MSSTNVHSNNMHICAGQAIPTEKGMDVPPQNAKRGPRRIQVIEGPNASITAFDNLIVREGEKVIGRATKNGEILSGDSLKVKNALNSRDVGRE